METKFGIHWLRSQDFEIYKKIFFFFLKPVFQGIKLLKTTNCYSSFLRWWEFHSKQQPLQCNNVLQLWLSVRNKQQPQLPSQHLCCFCYQTNLFEVFDTKTFAKSDIVLVCYPQSFAKSLKHFLLFLVQQLE